MDFIPLENAEMKVIGLKSITVADCPKCRRHTLESVDIWKPDENGVARKCGLYYKCTQCGHTLG